MNKTKKLYIILGFLIVFFIVFIILIWILKEKNKSISINDDTALNNAINQYYEELIYSKWIETHSNGNYEYSLNDILIESGNKYIVSSKYDYNKTLLMIECEKKQCRKNIIIKYVEEDSNISKENIIKSNEDLYMYLNTIGMGLIEKKIINNFVFEDGYLYLTINQLIDLGFSFDSESKCNKDNTKIIFLKTKESYLLADIILDC